MALTSAVQIQLDRARDLETRNGRADGCAGKGKWISTGEAFGAPGAGGAVAIGAGHKVFCHALDGGATIGGGVGKFSLESTAELPD